MQDQLTFSVDGLFGQGAVMFNDICPLRANISRLVPQTGESEGARVCNNSRRR